MDLRSGRKIIRYKVTEFPITDTVIRTVEEMARSQGMYDYSSKSKTGEILHDTDWIAGVEFADDHPNDDNDNMVEDLVIADDEMFEEADEVDPEPNSANEQHDEEAVAEILADKEESDPPSVDEANDGNDAEENDSDSNADNAQNNDNSEEDEASSDSETTSSDDSQPESAPAPVRTTRSGRAVRQPAKFSPHHGKGRSYHQTGKVKEWCHNLVAQVHSNPALDIAYNYDEAVVLSRIMTEWNQKESMQAACFGQQYMLKKGLEKFSDQGIQGAMKELQQMHHRVCFAP